MNSDKVSKFIKEIRKKNNLTQKDLADKYNVTYQAVSKWENGINLPDITLLRQMSKDFNVSIENILDGNTAKSKKTKKVLVLGLVLIIICAGIGIYLFFKKDETFKFKTLSASCSEFKVSGSIAYDKEKSSIYISHIDYCGGDDDKKYDEIKCNLYEKNNNTNTMISSCQKKKNINLEDYLKEVQLNIDNYSKTCKKYNDDSLYLEIEAKIQDDIKTYKIPLKLNENCPEK